MYIKTLWQGVLYPVGTCIYEGGLNNNPWCSLDAAVTNDAYSGAAGQTNWGYCNCSASKDLQFKTLYHFCQKANQSYVASSNGR